MRLTGFSDWTVWVLEMPESLCIRVSSSVSCYADVVCSYQFEADDFREWVDREQKEIEPLGWSAFPVCM